MPKKKSQPEIEIPAKLKNRPSLWKNPDVLPKITASRKTVDESLISDPLRHDFISVKKDWGHVDTNPTWAQKCKDCAFQISFDPILWPSDDAKAKGKEGQCTTICLQCSIHHRGPNHYWVCEDCSTEFEDVNEEDSEYTEGVVNYHTKIFYEDEPNIDRMRERKRNKKSTPPAVAPPPPRKSTRGSSIK